MCECPAHVDLRPSLSVTSRDGRVLVHCHAGCPQSAVIGALRRRGLVGRRDRPGLEARSIQSRTLRTLRTPQHPLAWGRNATLCGRGAAPCRSRAAASPISISSNRGLRSTDGEARSLRFSPSLWHWPSRTRWPAMLARVTSAAGEELTTHQTFLAPRRLRQSAARRQGAAVRGGQRMGGRRNLVRRGGSGARIPRRRRRRDPCLSALGCSAPRRMRGACRRAGSAGWSCRPAAKKIRIFADHDIKGQGLAAAQAAKRRWTAEGREVAISISPVIGWDANDILLQQLGRLDG